MKRQAATRWETERVLTVREVARVLRCGPKAIYGAIKKRRLRAMLVGKGFKIPASALADFLRGR